MIPFICSSSYFLLSLIILSISSRDDVFPPFLVIQVPLDSLLNTVLEHGFRQPAEFVVDLGWVDSVTLVVTLAVSNVFDQGVRLVQVVTDQLNDVDVVHFVVATDVVDFANRPLFQNEVDGLAVVFNVKPVADVLTFTVNRQRLVVQGSLNHQWDQLFRELVRAVVI